MSSQSSQHGGRITRRQHPHTETMRTHDQNQRRVIMLKEIIQIMLLLRKKRCENKWVRAISHVRDWETKTKGSGCISHYFAAHGTHSTKWCCRLLQLFPPWFRSSLPPNSEAFLELTETAKGSKQVALHLGIVHLGNGESSRNADYKQWCSTLVARVIGSSCIIFQMLGAASSTSFIWALALCQGVFSSSGVK